MSVSKYIIVKKEEDDENDFFRKEFNIPEEDMDKLRDARGTIDEIMKKNDIDIEILLFSVTN